MSLPNVPIDPDQLVARIRARQADAFNYLYDHYSAAIYGAILRIVTDETVAQEVLQDAFLKFWDKMDQYDASKGRLFTWMVNISRNLAIDKLRSKEMKKVEKTNPIETYVSDIESSQFGYQHVDAIGLKEALKKLREEERFVLEMVYFKGNTHAEIAEEYDIPIGTVKTRLRMALKNVRSVLKIS